MLPDIELNRNSVTNGMEAATKVNTTVKTFNRYVTIVRATNNTPYIAGQLICGASAINADGAVTYNGTRLIPIDLSGDGAVSNQCIQITQMSILSDQNPATSILSPIIQLYSPGDIVSDTLTFPDTAYKMETGLQVHIQNEFSNSFLLGTSGYLLMAPDMSKITRLWGNPAINVALIANNTYTPKSGERIQIRVKGFLL